MDMPIDSTLDDHKCRQLWAAVMMCAVDDLSSDYGLCRLKALRWFEDLGTEMGSCRWICDLLCIDYERVGQQIYQIQRAAGRPKYPDKHSRFSKPSGLRYCEWPGCTKRSRDTLCSYHKFLKRYREAKNAVSKVQNRENAGNQFENSCGERSHSRQAVEAV